MLDTEVPFEPGTEMTTVDISDPVWTKSPIRKSNCILNTELLSYATPTKLSLFGVADCSFEISSGNFKYKKNLYPVKSSELAI